MEKEIDNSMVSVIIPVYNMQDFLAKTIDSVLLSTYQSFEVIIVDDGSTDASYEVATEYSDKDKRVRCFTQENSGVSAARNHAIREAIGKYILPVDADNLISTDFIEAAVTVLDNNANVKVVRCKSVFFGDREGEWKLPEFSLKLLARKNMIDTCAMYRKSDWEFVGGYCENILGREDWEFWIALLKRDGEVVNLPFVGLKYRIRNNSKRITDRNHKRKVIEILNTRHKAFFYRELGGKLHYRRTWSRLFNFFIQLIKQDHIVVNPEFKYLDEFVYSIPGIFENEGISIYTGRNKIKLFEEKGYKIIIKSFRKPIFINRIIYGIFRVSKTRRSYDYAKRLINLGIGTPHPIGYFEQRTAFLFSKSFYASLQSKCNNTFNDLIKNPKFPERNEILKAIGRFTAELHEKGILHRDYSAGNILFEQKNNKIEIEILDLNRMDFGIVGLEKGCKNFERLNIDSESLTLMAKEYAAVRGFNQNLCIENMLKMRWSKHQQKNLN